MSAAEEGYPDVLLAGWEVDGNGNPFRLFQRLTTRAEEWHARNASVGVQFDRSIAVPKADVERVREKMKADGLCVKEKSGRKRNTYVGVPPRPPV